MKWTYLSLGDSYTIGEGVLLSESFPYQTVQLLRKGGVVEFTAPEIIAKTGWTTDELLASIEDTTLLNQYDIVSLLIGVNNQYRQRDAINFKTEFTELLQKAIGFAGKEAENVFVLSIPDWSVTPFAVSRDRLQIALEIDAYNEICKNETKALGCNFIDITTTQRLNGNSETHLAGDGLHPSGNEYATWANLLSARIREKLNYKFTDDKHPLSSR